MTLAPIRQIGDFYDPPNRWSETAPVLRFWWFGECSSPVGDDVGRLGGWSIRALREMAATFGTLNGDVDGV